jgi:antitoxin (DNA-binding transcriptional repressor) of toxin-antitoxin stability system
VFRRVADGEPLVIVAGRTRIPVAWLMPYLQREEKPLEEAGEDPDEKSRR